MAKSILLTLFTLTFVGLSWQLTPGPTTTYKTTDPESFVLEKLYHRIEAQEQKRENIDIFLNAELVGIGKGSDYTRALLAAGIEETMHKTIIDHLYAAERAILSHELDSKLNWAITFRALAAGYGQGIKLTNEDRFRIEQLSPPSVKDREEFFYELQSGHLHNALKARYMENLFIKDLDTKTIGLIDKLLRKYSL